MWGYKESLAITCLTKSHPYDFYTVCAAFVITVTCLLSCPVLTPSDPLLFQLVPLLLSHRTSGEGHSRATARVRKPEDEWAVS